MPARLTALDIGDVHGAGQRHLGGSDRLGQQPTDELIERSDGLTVQQTSTSEAVQLADATNLAPGPTR